MKAANILKDTRFKVFILLMLFICAYWIPLKSLVHVWLTSDDYSYGILIPVISAYLFWDYRFVLQEIKTKSSWSVLPVLIIFILLSLYGILGSSGNISKPVIPILIILFTAFCFGIYTTKRLILPLGILIFMIPLPPVLDRTFGIYLKMISSQLGSAFIRMCGLSVHVSGNVIDLGVTQLQVVDACSGLRFVFPLFAIGIIYAYMFERVMWKRIVCALAAIPIAIFTNGLRIGITGVLTYIYGPKAAQGFFHDFSGWAIFMAATFFLVILAQFLRLFPPKTQGKKINKQDKSIKQQRRNNNKGAGNNAFFVSVFLLLVVWGLSISTDTMPPVKLKGGMQSFPLAFGKWHGVSNPVDPEIIARSGAEESFSGLYKNQKKERVSLYMGYRSSAFMENKNFFHSPTVCLPASGWKNVATTKHVISNSPLFDNLKVTQMVVNRFGERQLVYFWFQTKNKATYDKNINRFHLALHAIRRDNTYDIFIRPMTSIGPHETIMDAQNRMDGFVREMMSGLHDFLKVNI